MTEENDPAASGRRRMFTLDGSEPQEQVYYLSHSRRLARSGMATAFAFRCGLLML